MSYPYGQRTLKKDVNGNMLYEFERVSFVKNGVKMNGTIVNVCDPKYVEFRVLPDPINWEVSAKPEYYKFNNNEVTVLTENDEGYRICRTDEDFVNYCRRYDYRGGLCFNAI